MSHPDGMAAFLSKRDVTAHFTSPPFMYRELEQPGIHRIMSSDDVDGRPDHVLEPVFDEQIPRRESPRL